MTASAAFIETFTGARFCPLAPVAADIRIHDIAHALSNQCRFSGHTRHFYSVAEHCVRVSRLITAAIATADETEGLWGLLHDASEAYLVDLPTPLKSTAELGKPYREAEWKVMLAVCERFGMDRTQPLVVEWADSVMLATEVRDLMPGRAEHWASIAHIPADEGRIVPWSPTVAEAEFLRRFDELTRVKR